MKRRYSTSLLACVMLLCFASSTFAQNLRPEGTIFLKPRIGFSNYLGDRDITPFDFTDWRFDEANKLPYSGAVELGYQFTAPFSISLAYQIADYPTIRVNNFGNVTSDGFPSGQEITESIRENAEDYDPYYTRRHTAQLLLRYRFGANSARVSPFLTLGAHGTVGYTDFSGGGEEDLTGYGPVGGIGLDIALNDRTSLVIEGLSNVVLPDDAADGVDEESPRDEEDQFSQFDVLSSIGLGLQLNLKSAFTPVEVMSLDCPSSLEVGESATFTGTVNDNEASQPINYDWDFDDGTSGTGLLATHNFSEAGDYTVTFTASNDGSTSSQTCQVSVEEPPVPAQVASLDASPRSFELCEPTTVTFSTNARGDEPVDYSWDFGDGSSGTGANPSHTYDTPGTYTVTLEVSNAEGTDERTLTVRAQECSGPAICDEVTEFNPVFFDRNSSTLTAEGRSALEDNIEILEQCPDLCVRVEGFASRSERNPQELSEARAEAIAQFYEDNGIGSDDIETEGMGAAGQTTKKGGGSQFRRADSIPMDCDELGMGMDDDDDM